MAGATMGQKQPLPAPDTAPRHRPPPIHLVGFLSPGPGPQEGKGGPGIPAERFVGDRFLPSTPPGPGWAWKFHGRCPAGATSAPEHSEKFPPTEIHPSCVIFRQSDTLCAWRNFIYFLCHCRHCNEETSITESLKRVIIKVIKISHSPLSRPTKNKL